LEDLGSAARSIKKEDLGIDEASLKTHPSSTKRGSGSKRFALWLHKLSYPSELPLQPMDYDKLPSF
jgi:hypothetical protein